MASTICFGGSSVCFVEHWGCMSTEGTLNVCHVFTGEKYLGVIKLQVICGGLSVIVCHVAESISFPLAIPLANHLSIFLSVPVMP